MVLASRSQWHSSHYVPIGSVVVVVIVDNPSTAAMAEGFVGQSMVEINSAGECSKEFA